MAKNRVRLLKGQRLPGLLDVIRKRPKKLPPGGGATASMFKRASMLKNIVYQLAGTTTIPPAEINIKALSAVTRSILPFMVNVEIGTSGEPFAQRLWGRTFTLLKGTHLLFAGREHEDLERHRAAQHADAMYNRRLFGRSRRWNVSEGARTTIYECQHEWLGMDEVRNTGVSDGEPTNSIYVAAMNQGSEMED